MIDVYGFFNNGIIGWNVESYPKKYNQDYFKEQMKINKLFVAKNHNKIRGVMLLKEEDINFWFDNKTSYYIHHLATDTNIKGVGKALLNYAIEECKKDNKEYLRLDCFRESIFLNGYYKEFGFNNFGSGMIGNYNYNLWEMKI